MRNIRFTPLIIFSIFLLLLSLGVMGNWAYKLFFKSKEVYTGELIVLKPIDSLNSTGFISESKEVTNKSSKKKTGEHSGREIETVAAPQQISKTNTQGYLPVSVPGKESKEEINKLKAEIAALLSNKTNEADLKLANQKIAELEHKINKLVDKNSDVERENDRLIAVLRKFSDKRISEEQNAKAWPAVFENNGRAIKTTSKPVQTAVVPVTKNSNTKTEPADNKKNIESPVFTVGSGNSTLGIDEMNLKAFMVTDNKELETYQAFQTDKFVGSLTVKNTGFPDNNGEIYIIVLQPDGRVLQKSSWETGTFQSPEGKRVYSCRLRFDVAKGESKKLTFSLNTSKCMKGNYIMQVYNKKSLIGKFLKLLS